MSKKVTNGETTYKKKIRANKKFKEDTFSLAGLQNYATKCFKDKTMNPDFLEFCKDNDLKVSDMKFKHVLDFGTERELNKTDKTGKVIEPKKLFSFWLFETCLARYRKANPIQKDLPVQVTITEKKKEVEGQAAKDKKAA